MKQSNGGPAFPRPSTDYGNGSQGMSLLSYYFGQLMSTGDYDIEHALNEAQDMVDYLKEKMSV